MFQRLTRVFKSQRLSVGALLSSVRKRRTYGVTNDEFPGQVMIPAVIREGDSISISLDEELPRRLPDGFVRIEVFPAISPIPIRNQFGFWDIDLCDLGEDWGARWTGNGVIRNNGVPPRGEQYREVRDSRSLMFHVSIWSTSAGSTSPNRKCLARLSVQSFFLVSDALPALRDVWMPVTGRCNLNCIMCGRTKRVRRPLVNLTFRDEDTPPNITDQVLKIANRLEAVGIIGFGEPLLVPTFFDLVSTLKAKLPDYARVGITSNGTVLDHEICLEILDKGPDIITFSVDGATALTYEKIRVGAKFEDVVENIRRLVRLKNEHGSNHPEVRISYVIMRQNYHEIVDFVRLSHSIGLTQVDFWLESETAVLLPRAEIKALLEQATEVGQGLGVKVNHQNCAFTEQPSTLTERQHRKSVLEYHERVENVLADQTVFAPRGSNMIPYVDGSENEFGNAREATGEDLYCPYMETLLIEHSGDVNPCCNYWNIDTLKLKQRFGNANQQDIASIWNSVTYQSFRHRVIHQRWPAACRQCPARRPRYTVTGQ